MSSSVRKIAIDARIINTSTGRYVERLLEHLQTIDKVNEYLVILNDEDFDSWKPKAANFKKVRANAPVYSIAEQLRFCWQLYRLRADLVHFSMPNYPILYLRPFITTVHDLTLIKHDNNEGNRLVYKIKQLLFKKILFCQCLLAKNIIVPTKQTEMELHRFSKRSKKKTVQIYEAAEPLTRKKPQALKDLGGKDFVMYVGNAYPYKNLKTAIKALERLHGTYPDLHLVLVGKKSYFYERLESYVAEKNVGNVVFTGFISDEQLAWLYGHTKAYLFPSISEGFGLPGLEAMQYRVPLIASNASCLPEVYADAALYFNPYDDEELAARISDVLNNNDLRQKLIDKGQRRLAKFSWKKMAEETLEVYKASLNR